MASNPLLIIPDFFLHFPNQLSYGYLRFDRFAKLKEGHCTLFFCHSHSHSHSHNDIGNVYLLFLSKATG